MKAEELIEILRQLPGADVETMTDHASYSTEIRREDIVFDEDANVILITGCH